VPRGDERERTQANKLHDLSSERSLNATKGAYGCFASMGNAAIP
jgi:hypothetical protein